MTDTSDMAANGTDAFSGGEHMGSDDFLTYLSGAVSAEAKRAFERHVLVCRDCRHALVEAGRRKGAEARTRMMRRAAPAAAVVVVLVAATVVLRSPGISDPVFRGGQEADGFAALVPVDAAVVSADSAVFAWRPAGSDAYYVLTIINAQGDVAWSLEPSDTTVVIADEAGLVPGQTYYWFVDAFLAGANTATTGVQEFRVR